MKCYVILASTRIGDPSLFLIFFFPSWSDVCNQKTNQQQQQKKKTNKNPTNNKQTKKEKKREKYVSSAENESDESVPWNPAGTPSALLMELSGFHLNSSVSHPAPSAEGRCGFTGSIGPCSLWVFKAWAIILNWKQRCWCYYKIV